MRKLLSVVGAFAVAMGVMAWSAQAEDAAKPDRKQERRQAKDGAGAGEKHAPGAVLERIQKVTAELNLTDDQKTKITGFLSDARTKLKELRETAKGDREKAREQVKAIVQETRTNVIGVLTDDQKAKLRELMKEHRGERKGGAGEKPAGKPAA